MTNDMLEEISQADYGMGAEAHLAALVALRDEMHVPAPMPWEPKEVLQLMRWSQPDDPNVQNASTGERGHTIRAFCCAALLRAAAEPANEGYFDGENSTLIQLIESALSLERGLPELAGRFLTWRIPRMRTDDEESPLFAFGFLALAGLIRPQPLVASDLDELVSFVENVEADLRDPTGACTREMFEGSSFLACTNFDLRHAAWRGLAVRLRSAMPDSDRVVALARRVELK